MNADTDFTGCVQQNLLQQMTSGNEDALFIKFWKNKQNAETIKNLKVYLYTATKNTCLNYLSSKAHSSIAEPFDAINIELAGPICPDQLLIFRETFVKIKDAIETLPPKCKMIFKLIREDGLKYKEGTIYRIRFFL